MMFLRFLSSIFLGSGGIVDKLEKAYQAKLTAQNDAQRIAAEQEIQFWDQRVAALNTAATSDRWWSPRTVISYCVAIFVAKIIVYDTVFKLGVTPDPGVLVKWIVVTVIGFFFVSRSAEVIAARLANRIKG